MGATEQQLGYLTIMDIDVSSYMNILLSFGFIVFVFAFLLIYLWETLTDYPNGQSSTTTRNHGGYTEVNNDTEAMLAPSSSFLDDNDSEDHDALELKDTTRRTTIPPM